MRTYKQIVAAAVVAVVMLCAACAFAFWPQGAGAGHNAVEPKQSLEAYSWAELSTVAAKISACESQADAYAVANRYGLCAADGTIDGSQVKRVELDDGTAFDVRLADVWHDVRSDGGRAGLSFVFAQAPVQHAMNHAFENSDGDDADSTGGWAASDMRAWLDGELLYALPVDLRAAIVPVQKRTASRPNVLAELDESGHLSGSAASWADETSDRLWLLSAAELCGAVSANETLGVDDAMSAVYGSEGEQYRLFADAGIEAFAPNALTALQDEGAPITWWLRTKTLEFGDGFWLVGTDGTPLNGLGEDARVVTDAQYAPKELWGPDHARGVVAGFCL